MEVRSLIREAVSRSAPSVSTVPVVCAACHKAMAVATDALVGGGTTACEFCGAVTDLGPLALRLPARLDAHHVGFGPVRHLSEFP